MKCLCMYAFAQAFNMKNMQLGFTPKPYVGETMLGSAENIANVLYTKYLLPFELVAVLLLIAIIAAISLGQRQSPYKTK